MNLELHCIKQKTSALIKACIGYYHIIPTNKKLLLKMTSVLPVRLLLFREFLKKSDKNRLESKKPYSFSRNKALKCRGREIRTPDLLLPKQGENPL